ncbi:MAG: DeoR/GlpR family DNA-binding transcription regulator [Lachnospiraceae bacterium]|nr:DeoR/GlpR family DNA-binding transcription regulator [Lachnospiraceae bacterium]
MKNNRRDVDNRHRRILDMIRARGEVKVEELTREFGVSAMTARRDLQYMEQEGLLSRTHGGAVSLERANTRLTQDEKTVLCRDRISEYASRLVDDGDRLFINGSLTALNLLKYLGKKRVSVFTNNCRAVGENY